MPRLRAVMALGLALGSALVSSRGGTSGEAPLAVIVHPDRIVNLSRDDVERIYLCRRRFWDDGSAIVPLNLPAGDPRRERFSRQLLHADSAHLSSYWNEEYFHGIFPPTVLSSSAAVKRYVATNRNAIGYIDAADVDATVRTVLSVD